MLILSISSTSTNPTDQASASRRISSASRSRVWGSSFFESSTPVIRISGRNTTAPAATGPASGLMPASSTPATVIIPADQRASSYRSILRRRCPSDRASKRRRSTACRMARAAARGSLRSARSVAVSSGRPSVMCRRRSSLSERVTVALYPRCRAGQGLQPSFRCGFLEPAYTTRVGSSDLAQEAHHENQIHKARTHRPPG